VNSLRKSLSLTWVKVFKLWL